VISKTILLILAPLLSAGLSAAMTRYLRATAIRRLWVDQPGGHKGHDRPVALGGGIAVTLAWIIPVMLAAIAARMMAGDAPSWAPDFIRLHLGGLTSKAPIALALVAASAAMCAMGFLDDLRPLSPRFKLILQTIIVVFLVVGFDLRLLAHLGYVPSVGLSVLWLLTLVNAMNFLDNMDGLSSGVAVIASAVFAVTATSTGQIFVPACTLCLTGALLGFLPYNISPASIFLGDAGSQVIGLLLGAFTILTTFADPAMGLRPVGVIAPIVVMAVPLYDTVSVVLLRWRSGAPIWTGDRRHFSHRLVKRGMKPRQAVAVIWLATLVTALPAILLPHASWPLAWGILVQTLLVVMLVALLEEKGAEG
jgi:UDP-GlcNAc:undecaprenyl-phosphate GlcNAc-1-phosphate transferase